MLFESKAFPKENSTKQGTLQQQQRRGQKTATATTTASWTASSHNNLFRALIDREAPVSAKLLQAAPRRHPAQFSYLRWLVDTNMLLWKSRIVIEVDCRWLGLFEMLTRSWLQNHLAWRLCNKNDRPMYRPWSTKHMKSNTVGTVDKCWTASASKISSSKA